MSGGTFKHSLKGTAKGKSKKGGSNMKKVVSLVLVFLMMSTVVIGTNSSVSATPESVIQYYRTKIITYATGAIGADYAEEGETRFGPNTYDCSGLAYKAYIGINIPSSTAAAQAYYQVVTMKKSTPYANRRYGDLIFYDLYKNNNNRYHDIDHVAICAGNGYIIDAGSPGVTKRLDTHFNSSSVTETAVPLY